MSHVQAERLGTQFFVLFMPEARHNIILPNVYLILAAYINDNRGFTQPNQ